MTAPEATTPPTAGKLAILGAGTMGATLLSALLDTGALTAGAVTVSAQHEATLERFADRFGVAGTLDNRRAVEGAGTVLLAVKPQVAPSVLAELAGHLSADQVVVSIVAGLTTAKMESLLGAGVPVVRAMPNTPSRIGAGMTAVCGGRWAEDTHTEAARDLFARLGRCLVLDEKHFDAVTGLSASGPAFIYVIIEALAEGGVKVGLPRGVATELAAQTCLGAARMVIETGHHPALLKDEVTTPAGCTVDGLLTLEEGGLRVTLIKAIVEASRRAHELVDG